MPQQFRLKPGAADFDVVDGKYAGRKYRAGEVYENEDIPPGERSKFEPVPAAVAAVDTPDAVGTEEVVVAKGGKQK